MSEEPVPLSFQNMVELRSGGLEPGNPILAVIFPLEHQAFSSLGCTLCSRGRFIHLADHGLAGGSKAWELREAKCLRLSLGSHPAHF